MNIINCSSYFGGLGLEIEGKNWNSSGSELCWFCSLALVTLNMTIVYTYVQPCSNHIVHDRSVWSADATTKPNVKAQLMTVLRKIIITCWFVQTANGHDEMLTLSISLLSLWSNDRAYPKKSMKNTKTWSGRKWKKIRVKCSQNILSGQTTQLRNCAELLFRWLIADETGKSDFLSRIFLIFASFLRRSLVVSCLLEARVNRETKNWKQTSLKVISKWKTNTFELLRARRLSW